MNTPSLHSLSGSELACRRKRTRAWLGRHGRDDAHYASIVAYEALLQAESSERARQDRLTAGPVLGPISGSGHLSRFDVALARKLRLPRPTPLGDSALRGVIGETSFATRTLRGLFARNLNSAQANQPLWDFLTPGGALIQTNVSAARSERGQVQYVYEGWEDVTGISRPRLLAGAVESAPIQQAVPGLTARSAIGRGEVAVNSDLVNPVRQRVRTLVADPDNLQTFEQVQQLYDVILERDPVTIPGKPLVVSATGDLQSALNAGDLTAADATIVYEHVADAAASKVSSLGSDTGEIRRLVTLANRPEQARVTPEQVLRVRLGGTLASARWAGARGFAGSVLVGESLELLSGRPVQDTARPAAISGLAGYVDAAASTAAEPLVMRGFLAAGASDGLAVTGTRVLSRGVGGGLAAPVVIILSMAADDRHYTTADYASKGTRAAASGAVSAMLTAALVGSVGGPLGFLLGLGVGLGTYWLADATLGEGVEQLVRSGFDDDCPPGTTPAADDAQTEQEAQAAGR